MIDIPEEYHKMHGVEEQLWWYKALHQFVKDAIEASFKSNKNIKIIDIGCGTGGLLLALKNAGYNNIEGIDHAEVAVELSTKRGFDVKKASMNQLIFNEKFDVIISNDTFCYLKDEEIQSTIIAFKNALAPNGIIITNHNAFDIFWGTHDISIASERRFTWKYFDKLLTVNNLKPKQKTYWTFVLSPMVLIIRLSQRLFHYISPKENYSSDVDLPSNWLNTLLYKLVLFEKNLISFQPFGSSLFWVAIHKELDTSKD